MRSPTLAAALLALSCGCGTHESHPTVYHVIDSDAGGVTVEEEGVSIVVVDVPYRSSSSTVNGRTKGARALLGHPFGISEGHFYIGPVNYGPAPAGSKILVAKDGVTIDGERRGDVPPVISETIDGTAQETVADDGRATVEIQGIVIEVEPPIVYRSTLTMEGGRTERSSTIAGEEYGVEDGVLRIGDTSYDAVGNGDRVRVSAGGVFVNDERRGDAP